MADTFTDHILKNSTFHQLDPPDQIEFLKQNDPEFAKLRMSQQFHIINDAKGKMGASAAQPEKTGMDQLGDFAKTVGSNALAIPVGAYNMFAHPLDTAKGMYDAQKNQLMQAWEDKDPDGRPKSPMERAGRAVAGALPILGPMAAQAGDDIGRGDYGKGIANGATAIMAGTSGGRGMAADGVSSAISNTVGRTPVGKVYRAAKAGGKSLLDQYVPKAAKAAVDAYKGTPAPIETAADTTLKEFEATRKVSRPARADGPGRTTDDLNPIDANTVPQKAAPIDKSKMVKRETTTDDLNPVEAAASTQKAAPVDRSKMVKRETTTDDLNPPEAEKALSPRMQRKADWEELQTNTRKVTRPIKGKTFERTTDDLNPNESQTNQAPAPVDKSIVSRVERMKALTPEEGEEVSSPPKTTQQPASTTKVDNSKVSSEAPGSETYNQTTHKPEITQTQIDAAQNEFRVPKANNYASHLHKNGYTAEDLGNFSHEQWKAFAAETDEHIPSVATIDRIKGEMARLGREQQQP